MNDEQKQRYLKYFQTVDTENSGKVTGVKARQFFGRSNLPKETLAKIWRLSDSNQKGYLTRGEFIVSVHLLALSKAGTDLPNALPMVLQNYLMQEAM